jgi:hypothetical protein
MRLPVWFSRPSNRSVVVSQGKSIHIPELSLVISSGGVWYQANPLGERFRKTKPDTVELVIGAPGLPNTKSSLELGDAVLYQTPNYGVVEVRVTEVGPPTKLMVSVVSPRNSFSATYDSSQIHNGPFAEDEVLKIRSGIENVVQTVSKNTAVSPEQLQLLNAKLEEIALAASRLGRKDWIMFAAGTLTNVIVGAAFSPEVAKSIFAAMNSELAWVFNNALLAIAQ